MADLEQAREAYRRRDFETAFRELAAVRERSRGAAGDLGTEDLDTMADAAWWLGLTTETLTLTEEVHRRYLDEGHVDRAALNAVGVGFLWMLRGDEAIGSGWIHRARRLLAGHEDCEATGMLRFLEATAALERNDLDTARSAARDLLRLGAELHAPTLGALGLLTEGLAAIQDADLTEGFALLDEAMLPVLAGEVEAGMAGNVYCSIMGVCSQLADVPRVRQWLTATERWCAGFSDAVMFLGICRAHRVELLTLEGAWEEAAREADRVRAELADSNAGVVAECEYLVGEVHRIRGDADAASAAYERARERGRRPQPGEALLLLEAGRATDAWVAINGALTDGDPHPFRRARLLRAKVHIGLGTGHLGGAVTAAEELAGIAARYPTPGFASWSRDAQGSVLLERGLPAEALPHLVAACRAYESMPDELAAARVRGRLARALRLTGDADGASGQESLAEAGFRRMGVPPSYAGREDRPGGLTDRELEVLGLVAGGARNREAAERLVISEKTVRRHLANIYAKLGVGSRTAAAAWMHEQGLVRRP